MDGSTGDVITWPEAVIALGFLFGILFLIGLAVVTVREFRKTKVLANQENDLRQLVHRYEQLAENILDAQQRVAADAAELRSRTASIEKILRTVE